MTKSPTHNIGVIKTQLMRVHTGFHLGRKKYGSNHSKKFDNPAVLAYAAINVETRKFKINMHSVDRLLTDTNFI